MARSGRPAKREDDPTLKVNTLAVSSAVRVWGGSRRDLSDRLRERGIDYNPGSVHDLVRGNAKSTYRSVLVVIAEITLGNGEHFTELLAGDDVERPVLLAAMAVYFGDFQAAFTRDFAALRQGEAT